MKCKESTDKKKDDECSLAPAALINKLDGKDVGPCVFSHVYYKCANKWKWKKEEIKKDGMSLSSAGGFLFVWIVKVINIQFRQVCFYTLHDYIITWSCII